MARTAACMRLRRCLGSLITSSNGVDGDDVFPSAATCKALSYQARGTGVVRDTGPTLVVQGIPLHATGSGPTPATSGSPNGHGRPEGRPRQLPNNAYCLRAAAEFTSPTVLTTVWAVFMSRLNSCDATWKSTIVDGSFLLALSAADFISLNELVICSFSPSIIAASQLRPWVAARAWTRSASRICSSPSRARSE